MLTGNYFLNLIQRITRKRELLKLLLINLLISQYTYIYISLWEAIIFSVTIYSMHKCDIFNIEKYSN